MTPELFNPHPPAKAQPGKLYEMRLTPWEIADLEPPKYFIFDTHGKPTNKTWEPGLVTSCLVLNQDDVFTVVLVGEDIIHVADDELDWKVELIPLKQPSNHNDP